MPSSFDRVAFRSRLVRLRRDRVGDDGIADLARELGIPAKTWANYEAGILVPDSILLRLLCLTGASPRWLLTGQDEPYAVPAKPTILPR